MDADELPLASPVLGPVPNQSVTGKSPIEVCRAKMWRKGCCESRIRAQIVRPRAAIDVRSILFWVIRDLDGGRLGIPLSSPCHHRKHNWVGDGR